MVKIYTGKGDDGTTSLWYGGRVLKSGLRTEAYGTLDGAVAALGVVRAGCDDERLARDLLRLQRELFVVGAELATASEARERLQPGVSKADDEMVKRLEDQIDSYMAEVELPPKFVIPGGTMLSARLDVARAKLRGAERRVVELAQSEEVAPTALRYLNRAADLLFAMARYADEPSPELFEGRS